MVLTRRSVFRELESLLKRRRGSVAPSILIIGDPGQDVTTLAGRYPVKLTVLAKEGYRAPAGVIVYHTRPEFAPFLPEQFDVVVCVQPVEQFDSHHELLRNAWRWLVPEGGLILHGGNAASLLSQLRPGARRKVSAAGERRVNPVFGGNHLKQLAGEYGFEVQTFRSSSSVTGVARRLFGAGFPSALAWVLAAPVAGLSTGLNMGDQMTAVCVKRGVAMKPLLRPIEQTMERGQHGLAPALFTGSGNMHRQN